LFLGGIVIIYFNCGSSTKEVITTEETPVLSKAAQDSVDVKKKKRLVDIEFNFAYAYFVHKDFKEAIPHYWKAINNDKELRYPGMYHQLGQCYIEIEEADSALMVYEMGVERVPDNVYIHERLTWLYEAKSEFEKAIGATLKVIELGGDKNYYLMKLKNLYLRNNQISEAINVYDKLIELEPENKELKDQKTNLIKLSGGSVIDEYKKLHEKYPNDKKYIEALLIEFSGENDDANVLLMADKLLALEPDNILALEKKSDVYANLQKWKDRIDVLNRKLEIAGDNPEVLTDISESYNNLKDYKTARSYAGRALKIDSNYGMAYIRIGEAYEYCVEDVVSKKGGFDEIKFDDKLIYEFAFKQYEKALNSADSAGIASRKMNAIKNLLPTKEDKFMNPDKKKAENPAYQWMY